MADVSGLEKVLGHHFTRKALAEEAMTHASFANEHPGRPSNERLVHLGDAVLELIVRDRLFHDRGQARKGELTDAKKPWVNNKALAAAAANWPKPDVSSGLSWLMGRQKIMAQTVEAVVGAVYEDTHDLAITTAVVRRILPLGS